MRLPAGGIIVFKELLFSMNRVKPDILILTWGSMGDVLPLIALAKQLQKDGQRVIFGAPGFFAPVVKAHGIDFRRIGSPVTETHYNQVMDTIRSEPNPRKQMQILLQQVLLSDLEQQYTDSLAAARESDVVLSHWMQIAGSMAAEALGKPLATVTFNPVGISCISEQPFSNRAPDRRHDNIGRTLSDFLWGRAVHEFRERVGLKPVASVTESQYSEHLNLVAVSRYLLPDRRDWPPNHQAVGFCYLEDDSNWMPDDKLRRFLESGEKPIVVSFGSMAGTDAAETTRVLAGALAQIGQRAIVQAGWAGLGETSLPDNILAIGYAPHHWLFSKASCVVHHGGAGTTAAALRAGVPSVVVWHMLDQPYWGNSLAQLGLGPKPLSRFNMTVEALAAGLRSVLGSESFTLACRAMADKIASEGGVREAAQRVRDFAFARMAGKQRELLT